MSTHYKESHVGSLLDLLENVSLFQGSLSLPILTTLSRPPNTSPDNHVRELLLVLVGVGGGQSAVRQAGVGDEKLLGQGEGFAGDQRLVLVFEGGELELAVGEGVLQLIEENHLAAQLIELGADLLSARWLRLQPKLLKRKYAYKSHARRILENKAQEIQESVLINHMSGEY